MSMQRLVASAAFSAAVLLAPLAHAERSTITTTSDGNELHVIVHGVTEYCATNAHTTIVRSGSTIRIVRDRPSQVSRCIGARDLSFVVHDVPAGTYTVTYERIPMLAPARALKLAWATAVVSG